MAESQDICAYEPGPGGDVEPNRILYPLQSVAQPGMGGIVSNPPPSIDQLKQVFLLSKAQLTAIGAKRTASCPTTVRFEGRIAANGPGTVKYRTEINGQTGPLRTLGFNAMGEKVVKFETQVDMSQQQGGSIGLTTQAQPANVVNGQARIVIESPSEGVSESNFAKYEITCTALGPAGNLSQSGAASGPAPRRVGAPAPAVMGIATLALPDLRIVDANVDRSRPTIVRVKIVNRGQAVADATRVRVWTSEGNSWYTTTPTLGIGQEAWVRVQADMPVMRARNVHARVDDPNRVKELDELNNSRTIK